jgi:hypothetical protein
MKMNKYMIMLLLTCTMAACKKQNFIDTNINPATLYAVDPADQFLSAASGSQDDFEYYYDVYRAMNYWMQYSTNGGGNSAGIVNATSNSNYRYAKIFYGRVGTYLTDIPALVSKMEANDQPKHVYQINIAAIFKAYYAFYVSDVNGSIPYSEAFQARYGGIITPKYDAQQVLFDTLDLQIKNAVASLETPQTADQILYGTKDVFFPSDEVAHWIKIGNAIRLKMAMRLMKRDPSKLQSIATEVLSDANQMSGIADSWVLPVGASFADGTGNYNPGGFNASKPVVDFMLAKSDPRLRIFYRPNLKDGSYVGAPPSPDDVAANQNLFLHADTLVSQLQHRLFTPNYDETDGNGVGAGTGFYPFLTYAEYCFIRAELGARGISSDDAATWYNEGVTSSIWFYDKWAQSVKITGYTPVTQTEIDDYLGATGVTFDAGKAVEQIACQAYLDFFRQPNEAWAWWKRTGYPNTSSVLAWSPLISNGTTLALPRRASLNLLLVTDANYENQKAAFADMAADPNFGNGPNDNKGRVWWDMP